MFQLPTSARRVVSVEGLDRLAGLAGVSSVFLNRSPETRSTGASELATTSMRSPGFPRATTRLLEVDRFLHEEVSDVYE